MKNLATVALLGGVALFGIVVLTSIVQQGGQPAEIVEAPDNIEEESRALSIVGQHNQHYLNDSPQLGTVIRSIPGLDEQGEAFESNAIEGKYSVFVFGCLT